MLLLSNTAVHRCWSSGPYRQRSILGRWMPALGRGRCWLPPRLGTPWPTTCTRPRLPMGPRSQTLHRRGSDHHLHRWRRQPPLCVVDKRHRRAGCRNCHSGQGGCGPGGLARRVVGAQGWTSAAPAFSQVASALPAASGLGAPPPVVPPAPAGPFGPSVANMAGRGGTSSPLVARYYVRPTMVQRPVYAG
jgi:hypothetical protein